MNKHFKKLFSVFLVFTIGTLGVVFATQTAFASSNYIIDWSSQDNDRESGQELNYLFTGSRDDSDGYMLKSGEQLEITQYGLNFKSRNLRFNDMNTSYDIYLSHVSFDWSSQDNDRESGQELNYLFTGSRDDSDGYTLKSGEQLRISQYGFDFNSRSLKFNEMNTDYDVKITLAAPDNTRPAIDGQENAVTNVNNPEDVNFFVKLFRAIDDVDGDISDRIVIDNDGYTANKTKLGKYPVTISATDDAGNKATLTFYINVVDIDNPIITGDATKARISYDKTFDVEAFRKTLDVSDNYDVLANSAITIKSDGYTDNKTKLGNYEVVYTAKDSSGNSTTFTKPIEVFDGVKPSFSGITTFTKGYNKIISVQEIIKDVKANDYIDGDITNTIKIKRDGYTGNANKVGTYEVELEVSDKAGNKAQHLIKITVTDDKGADWYIENGYTINLAPDATLTRTQIVELLVRNKQVNASANSRVTYTYDNYSDNVGEPGVYVLGFTITEPNGNESAHEYAINVMSSDDTNDDNQDTLPGDFEIKDHLKKYGVYYLIGIIAVAGLAVVVFRKK